MPEIFLGPLGQHPAGTQSGAGMWCEGQKHRGRDGYVTVIQGCFRATSGHGQARGPRGHRKDISRHPNLLPCIALAASRQQDKV